MFRGSIPAPAQAIVSEIVASWPSSSPIQVLCSGNLTVERSIARTKRDVYGNDITLYSCALGAAAAAQQFPVTIGEPYQGTWGWLSKYLPADDPAATAATIVLMSRCISVIDKPDHPYYARLADGTVRQWEELHGKTTEKYRKNLPKLAGFRMAGAIETLREVPSDWGVITFPPFFAGDYEAMFRRLAKLFIWQAPTFQSLDEEIIEEIITRATQHAEWIVALPTRHEKLEPYLRGKTQTTNRGIPINFYSNHAPRRLVLPRQEIETLKIPRLGADETLEGDLDVVVLTGGQFSMLRSQYMNQKIVPGSPLLAMGVTCGKRLIGAFAFAGEGGKGATGRGAIRDQIGSHTYLLSDFPIAPTKYARLAKLVLYAATSKEVKAAIEQTRGARTQSILTTAFTDRPVSMKYRGLFELLSRKENPKPSGPTQYKFQLNYWAKMGRWSLKEALAEWKKKHAVTEQS